MEALPYNGIVQWFADSWRDDVGIILYKTDSVDCIIISLFSKRINWGFMWRDCGTTLVGEGFHALPRYVQKVWYNRRGGLCV